MAAVRPADPPAAPAALSAETNPPTADDEPLARHFAEHGRDARGGQAAGSTIDRRSAAATAADGSGAGIIAHPGDEAAARIPGGERPPVRRREAANAGAVPAAVAHSPIRLDARTAQQAGKTAAMMSTASAPASPRAEHTGPDGLDRDNGDDGGGGRGGGRKAEQHQHQQQEQQQQERLRLTSARLADAAAGEFRQQRDKIFAVRLLAGWRCAAARERAKREAVSRLLRTRRQRRLGRGFARWRAGAQAARDKEERRTAREGATAAAATAKQAVAAAAKAVGAAGAAAAAKAAAEKLAREKEAELRQEKAAVEELRKTVERLQAEVLLYVGLSCMSARVRPHARSRAGSFFF